MKPINNLNTLHFLFPTLKLLRLIEGFTAELTTSREGSARTLTRTRSLPGWEVTWLKTIQGSAPARCSSALPSRTRSAPGRIQPLAISKAFESCLVNPRYQKIIAMVTGGKKKWQVCYNCFSQRFSCCSGSLLAPCRIVEQIFVEAVVESWS